MDVKQLLKHLKGLDIYIKTCKDEMLLYDEFLPSDSLKLVHLISRYKEELKGLIKGYESEKQTIMDLLDAMTNPVYKDILMMRYVKEMNWYDIADIVGYSYQHTHLLHNKAIEEFERLLKESSFF